MAPIAFDPPPAVGIRDLRARFGDIDVDLARQQIVSPPGWESKNMVRVDDLVGWAPKRIYVNKAIVAPLRYAMEECANLGDGYKVRQLGCFAPRRKRVNNDLSIHSWGLAIDANPDTNPLAPLPGPVAAVGSGLRDIPEAWVAIWEGCGWTWGGRFRRPDPMHFQFASGC